MAVEPNHNSKIPVKPEVQPRGRLAFLQDVKQSLLREYDNITRRLGTLMDKGKAMWNEYGSKDEENAAEVAEFQDTLSLEKNLTKSKTDIEAALAQVDSGTYGICQNCGKPIEPERLKVMPAAATCVSCVKKQRVGGK
jgi:RNA polymerase-binding transcription factor DksA